MAVRSLRSGRTRGDSGEESVPLDVSRDPAENVREILQNVAKQQGIPNVLKLAHLNNFVKLLRHVGVSEDRLGFSLEEIIICLRLALLNEAKEVRAAGLRALRHLTRDGGVLEKLLLLQVDYLIARCIDIQQNNEVERTQALRLARKMLSVNALLFPSSITNSLIAVGNDGLQQRDRLARACTAIICELSVKNPVAAARRGGLSTVLKSVTDCQLSRINEALITTILHLLNHPHTRQYIRSDVGLEQILAPYTDFHYRHTPELAEGQLQEDREARFTASKMSIVASFRSWSGIISLCKTGNSGIQSLIGLFCIPNMEVQKALLEVLFEVFLLAPPSATADFSEALMSIDPNRFQDSWRLSHGFVASEAKSILPHRSSSRPNLVNNYLAFVLSAFIKSGLLESLVEVITCSTDVVSIQATILVGELLHMANTLLPHSHSHHLHCLPSLINMAASFDGPSEKRLRAGTAVNRLKRFHERKKRGVRASSLYLDHILRTSGQSQACGNPLSRSHRDNSFLKDTEDTLMSIMRDSHVLSHKDSLEWNWDLIETVLKWPNISLRGSKDEQMHKFVQRLLSFYKPSSVLYGHLELKHPKAKQLTMVGCHFMDFLLASEEDGQVYLEDLVRDVVVCLFSPAGLRAERSRLLATLSQKYFLLLGTLSAHPNGIKVLEKCSVFQCLLRLCSVRNQEQLLKLSVSTLDYSRDGLARIVLSKILTAASDTCRLYATQHLRVLLRAGVEFFTNWGMELLVTQLHDRSRAVSMEALDILDEACEDKTNLHALTEIRPALTHLGDKGMLLQLRFASIPKGLSYLSERGYIKKQLEEWQQGYNLRYVDLIEGQLNEALTTNRQPAGGDGSLHRCSQRLQRPSVYLPVHLYGQLVQEKSGCQLLQTQGVVPGLSNLVRSPVLEHWQGIKQLKAALWALGHIGSSNWGVKLLQEDGLIPDLVSLAHHCEVLSVRGTCVYVLGLISKTWQGCDSLKQHGWDAVRHSLNTLWPVVPEELEPPSKPCAPLPSTAPPGHDGGSTHAGGSLQDRGGLENGGGVEESGVQTEQDSQQSAGDAAQVKMRSHSLNCGVGSLSSSPSGETLPSSDCLTVTTHSPLAPPSIHKSCSMSLDSPGSARAAPRRTQSLRSPGVRALSRSEDRGLVHWGSRRALPSATLKSSSFHGGRTSPRDAQGYATLRRLQQLRIQPSLSRSKALVSPATDLLFADVITMSTGSLASRRTSQRFLKALSFTSLDKEELLSPINQSTLQRSSSVRSIVSKAAFSSSRDYIGLALPVNISSMFQIKESLYFQRTGSPPEEHPAGITSGSSDGSSVGCETLGLPSQGLLESSVAEQQLGSDETGLQEHRHDNCLYCSALSVLELHLQSSSQEGADVPPPPEKSPPPSRSLLEAPVAAGPSGVSGCSDIVSQGSGGSTGSAELVVGVKFLPEDAAAGRVPLRKEVLRLVVNLSSSVGTKNHENSLLKIKEKFPHTFDDVCLYSEVSNLLAHCKFRLPARRFIQELFQDVSFLPMYEEAESILSLYVQKTSAPQSDSA
ncbi:rapamycin-insensitive companion of mTOR-like [Salarias fasciatus]|uniref:rapamycin-insensitive companion of mTOR-like n=1 Tax=Salarias fasciatus TaxID=181472 RepID=UPI001176F6B5|nr:rapamycin-insensitive companion of mTOR-like [Salarias fasciatus]